MKKIFVTLFLLVLCLSMFGCSTSSDDDKYKLTVIDDFGYLVKPLENYYKAGEEVEVHLAFLSGPSVGLNINGEYIGESAETIHVDGHPVISFIMPNKDSILYTTRNGYICKDCGEDNHQWGNGKIIKSDNNGYVVKYFCELCGKSKEVYGTVIDTEIKLLSDFLTILNPTVVELVKGNNEKMNWKSYFDFKSQLFFDKLSQIEFIEINSNMDYDMPSVDYYITFDNPQTNEWIELQLYGVYDANNGYYHYGRLKTNYLDGIFQFQMEINTFIEIYNYFINDAKLIDYYVFENGENKESSNYHCQQIIDIIIDAKEIEYSIYQIEKLNFEVLITTYEQPYDINKIDLFKYNYIWKIDYDTGIAVFCVLAPIFSSQLWPDRAFQLTEENINEIKDILTKQSYEQVYDLDLLSFYSETILINNVDGFPFVAMTDDVETTSRFEKVHERYNEEFFNEYSLAILKVQSNGVILGVNDIKFDGEKFTAIVDVTPDTSSIYLTRYYILKIKKSTLPVLEKNSYTVDVVINKNYDPIDFYG